MRKFRNETGGIQEGPWENTGRILRESRKVSMRILEGFRKDLGKIRIRKATYGDSVRILGESKKDFEGIQGRS